jgi:hypothetical protein
MTNQATSDDTARESIAEWYCEIESKAHINDECYQMADDLIDWLDRHSGLAIVPRGGVRLEMPVDTARGLQRVISLSPHQWAVRFREMVADAIAAAETEATTADSG